MSFEGKGKKSEQQFESPENKSEKGLYLSEIDEFLKEKADIFDSLDKFSKDEFYKKENFENSRVVVDKPDDRFDEEAYAKAGFWKKFENFTRFGLSKEQYGLIKSKDRGLLDKTKINKDIEGKVFKIGQGNNQEREYLESSVIDIRGYFKKDKSERDTVKAFGIDGVDGKIIKIVRSGRTEKGQIEAAGKKREAEISRLEAINGAELVGLKEAMERNVKSKESLLELSESMSNEEKERVTAKLDEEENQMNEKIKEKEEKLAEETDKFREPLEGRLKETIGIENDLKEALDFVKNDESKLKEQIKKCDENIKKSKKLSMLGDVSSDVVKIFEDKKVAFDAQAKEYGEKRTLLSSKLEVLKNNKKEIEATLSRVNNIGKTKQEIGKDKKWEDKETENKTEKKSTENKKSRTESFDTKGDENDEHGNEYKFKKFEHFFEGFKEKFPAQGEQITKLFDPTLSLEKFKEIVDQINSREQAPKEGIYDAFDYEIGNRGRSLTVKYFENGRVTVSVHFEDTSADRSDDEGEKKKTWEETRDEVWGLKNTTGKTESRKDGKTLNELFPDHDYPGRKKEKAEGKIEEYQDETEEEIEDKENEETAEKIFTKEEIAEIIMKELKVLGIMSIKDRTMREQITNNVRMAVEAMIAKSKEPVEENDIKKEVRDWYKKFTKNNSKKNK
ncbi:MAG: hypothetical protein KGJ58_01380 [Patescibacteria group bacterium]|nr:hypothetical protein [Patescibacteria group bacterium]MDE1988582.1 hypothetical protein [Patescibacteria group bacterium]MDE2218089.1 hypothetical protein [Patescibacteria group bacterium]